MKLHELLSDRSRWTKGAFARRESGATTPPSDPNAVCWCLAGAIQKCYPDDFLVISYKVSQKAVKQYDTLFTLPLFNDYAGYEAVLELVKDLDV